MIGRRPGPVPPAVLVALLATGLLAGCTGSPVTPAAHSSPPLTGSGPAHGAGSVSIYPLAGSVTASPQTQISFRGLPPTGPGQVTVTGSTTGQHPGRWLTHSDGKGASFVPASPFAAGETVMVRTGLDLVGGSNGTATFTVAQPVDVPANPIAPTVASATPASPTPGGPTTPLPLTSYVSRPDLKPPTVSVRATELPPDGQEVMLSASQSPTGGGPLIVDPDGSLVWYRPLPSGTSATDLKVQQYRGEPVLAWWQGVVSLPGYGQGKIEVADQHYRPVAEISPGNGYTADLHDFKLLPGGVALMTSYPTVKWDARSVGGSANATVFDCVVQEVDVATGAVEFEWHALDHVPLSDSYVQPPSNGNDPYDFFHLNSVDIGPSGDLLISARHTSTIYDLDPVSGGVQWQLGGRHSTYAVPAGGTFAYQHDVRWQGPDTLTIFDNAARDTDHKVADASRALVLHLDRAAHTVSLVAALNPPVSLLATSQGSVQLLPGGKTFVGWGSAPRLTEYGPDGQVIYDATMSFGQSYRAVLQRWTGAPAQSPAVTPRTDGSGRTTVAVSWNGDTRTVRWQVLAGNDPQHLAPVATAFRSGFETTVPLPGPAGYVAVRALDVSGAVLATSRPVRTQ